MPTSRDTLKAAGAVTAGAAGAALVLAALNQIVSKSAPPPTQPLGIEPQRFAWTQGDISYSVAGQGRALILLHGIYAGASSFEFRRVFAALARRQRVFAPDLPGCGLSAQAVREITPETYIGFINDFTRMVAGGADHPVTLVASSLTAAFAIEAAHDQPEMYSRLVIIEPAGIQLLAEAPGAGQTLAGKLVRAPLVGTALYHLLVSRPGLRSYLKRQVYLRPDEVTDDLVDAYYAVSHQPGTRAVTAGFIGGRLNLDISATFEQLELPILLCWGRRASVSPMENSYAFLDRNPRAELAVFDHSNALPHDEEPEDFVAQVEQWLRQSISSRY